MTRLILAALALAAVALLLVRPRRPEPVFWAGESLDDVDWLRELDVLTYSTN